jgi:hypothetical protein
VLDYANEIDNAIVYIQVHVGSYESRKFKTI